MSTETTTKTKTYVVIPESHDRSITWGPFETLAKARDWVARRGGYGLIVRSGDQRQENPRIWNWMDDDGE